MDDFKPNSNRFKKDLQTAEERQKVKKVVSGPVRTKKKSELAKLGDMLISQEASNVKAHIFIDVIVPAIRDTILDIITDSAYMVFGGSRNRRNRSSSEHISYDRFSGKGNSCSSSDISTRMGFDYENLIFDSYAEADAVREQLDEMISRYGIATVGDLYDAAGKSAPYTSNKYGWSNIRNAEPYRLRDGGYILKLPKAMPID